MPTRGRVHFASKAVECFLSQSYADKDLIILDDDDDSSFPSNWTEPLSVRRISENIRFNIPEKLNRLCELAAGEFIVRFDDDDWSSPDRIQSQVSRLLDSGLSVTGYHSIIFVDESGQIKKYRSTSDYACGSSMMFRKSFWEKNHFNEKFIVGSDNVFSRAARDAKQLISVDAGHMMYARAHSTNTSRKKMELFKEARTNEIPAVLIK